MSEELDLRIHRWFEGHEDPDLAGRIEQDPDVAARFVELADLESGLCEVLGRSQRTRDEQGASTRRIRVAARRRRASPRPSALPRWLGLAAAALVLLALAISFRPAPPLASPSPAVAEQPPELPAPPIPDRTPLPDSVVPPEPPPAAPPAPRPTPPRPDPLPPSVPSAKPETKPSDAVVPPPRPAAVAIAPKAVPLLLGEVAGTLLVRGAPSTGAQVLGADEIAASPRRGAGFSAGPGLRIRLERGAALRLEALDDGSLRADVLRGTAFFDGTRPFTLSAKQARAAVDDAAFQVDVDDRRVQLAVVRGELRLGDTAVKAGFLARPGERPAKGDVEALTAWRRRPELSPGPARTPFFEVEPGNNRRLAGLVLAAPYADAEPGSEMLARAAAERLDVPLVLARRHRAPDLGFWINVDRGMEAALAPDGTPGATSFTERARQETAAYLDRLRSAAGLSRGAVPLVVQVRIHYEKNLELAEAAFAGFPKASLAQVRALYPALLDKHKPPLRLELKFQGVDGRGVHAEDDPRLEGYMAPRNARNAAAFFFPDSLRASPESLAAYGKILADLIDALNARRR